MLDLTYLHSHRVFLRREALAHGYDDRDLRAAKRAGQVVRVRQGAYTAAEHWSSADPYARHRMLCHAVLATHSGVVLSHTSAAVMHGIALWDPDLSQVHLTRLDGTATRVSHDIRYHRGRIPADHVVHLKEGRSTTPARAAVEHASVASVESGLVAVDSYLHLYAQKDLREVEAVQRARRGWPGGSRLQITLRLARPGAESVGESRLRFLCWRFGLPEPELQVPIYDPAGALVGISDFGWRDHNLLGEFDGKVKYGRYLRPGEDPADAVFREKRREDLMREHSGCSMIRFTWADLHSPVHTATRLRHKLGLA
jgi:hypothetical protein